MLLVDHEVVDDGKLIRGESQERRILRSLHSLGHEVTPVAMSTPLDLLANIGEIGPAIVFNQTEHLSGDRHGDWRIAAILEANATPFTGSNARALQLTRDKIVVKSIAHSLGIETPDWIANPTSKDCDSVGYPAIIKPRFLDASEYISRLSVASSRDMATRRLEYLQKNGIDSYCERYIEGRDIVVGVINGRICRPCEFVLPSHDRRQAIIASYSAKHSRPYRKRMAIRVEYVELTREHKKTLRRSIDLMMKELSLGSYVRFDYRLSDEGGLQLLEVNANPSLTAAGTNKPNVWSLMSFQMLIDRILRYPALPADASCSIW